MTIKLPPMPETDWSLYMLAKNYEAAWTSTEPGYTAGDMEAYAREAVRLNMAPLSDREAYERAYNAGFVEASRIHGAEIERLRAALAKANEQAERFERGWYLRGDALEAIKKHCEPQPSVLAAAIVATCDNGLKA